MKKETNTHPRGRAWWLGALVVWLCAGCGDDAPGSGSAHLTVLIEAEDSIIDGVDAGSAVENIRDGWDLRYEHFLVAIGDVEIRRATDASVSARAADIHVVDLTTIDAAGVPLWEIDGLEAGEWEFFFSTPTADVGAVPQAPVTVGDVEAMTSAQATYQVAGTLTQTDGRSCPPPSLATPGQAPVVGTNAAGVDCYDNALVSFAWSVPASTAFGPCEVDGVSGFSVSAAGSTTTAITIHGDHLVFNGFPEGSEGGVSRLAQWLADCDVNLDGEVTQAELEAVRPSDLSELDGRFQLGGSPIKPLDDMWTYVRAQLMTQGHFQGEGECPLGAR